MKQIDIQDMLQELERGVRGVKLYLANKYDESKPKKQELFDLFESDYNNITLDKDKVIEMFNNVADKINDIINDVKDCGVHFEDFKKAASDFHDYCQRNKEQMEKDTKEFGLYQHELCNQITKNVNADMVHEFNDTFTETKFDRYFHNYIRKKGGNIKKSDLFNAIYCELPHLPSHCIDDGFDEKGHFLEWGKIPYDTNMVTANSVKCDTDGKPMFVFEYKRNKKGYFECLRMRFSNKWFVLYESDLK